MTQQYRVARLVRNPAIMDAAKKRLTIFCTLIFFVLVFFASELCVHVLLIPSEMFGLGESDGAALDLFIHELAELLVVDGIFWMYRAK